MRVSRPQTQVGLANAECEIERVLIVGLGSIGRRHLALTRDLLPEADIRVLRRAPDATPPPEASGVFSTLSEALAFGPQLSIVANPAPFHLPIATALAECGSHLLVEKPLSHASAGVAQLIALAERLGLRLQLAYNLRFLSSLGIFRKFVQDGRVGEVHTVRCEVGQYLPSWRPGKDYRQTVSAQRALGGGVLLELSHELDYLRWIFGDVAWVEAALLRQGKFEIDVEDSAHLLLGFAAPVACAPVASLTLDFIRRDTTRYCLALGSTGSVRWDGISGKVTHYSAERGDWCELYSPSSLDRNDTYRLQLENMLAGIASGEAPPVGGGDGLAVLHLIEAARRSAEDGGRRTRVGDLSTESR
ncbi:Gfo/Idh/MocA family protein [Sphingorhabdus sp.]|uniref:Gfo/Idh/MocA family protein n=1 Tax=Sphingorhabdus sp. TaxID=1902408 RepID=UPI0035AFF839